MRLARDQRRQLDAFQAIYDSLKPGEMLIIQLDLSDSDFWYVSRSGDKPREVDSHSRLEDAILEVMTT